MGKNFLYGVCVLCVLVVMLAGCGSLGVEAPGTSTSVASLPMVPTTMLPHLVAPLSPVDAGEFDIVLGVTSGSLFTVTLGIPAIGTGAIGGVDFYIGWSPLMDRLFIQTYETGVITFAVQAQETFTMSIAQGSKATEYTIEVLPSPDATDLQLRYDAMGDQVVFYIKNKGPIDAKEIWLQATFPVSSTVKRSDSTLHSLWGGCIAPKEIPSGVPTLALCRYTWFEKLSIQPGTNDEPHFTTTFLESPLVMYLMTTDQWEKEFLTQPWPQGLCYWEKHEWGDIFVCHFEQLPSGGNAFVRVPWVQVEPFKADIFTGEQPEINPRDNYR